jgi:hypothetical protein
VNVANATGWFKTSTVYSEKDIPAWALTKYEEILRLRRGGGYWIWRFPLIQKKADEIEDGKLIIWLDSDHGISHNNDGGILMEWAALLQQEDKGVLLFRIPYIEEFWTTERVFKAFNISTNNAYVRDTEQINAGAQVFRKCNDLQEHLALFFSVLEIDQWIITDN